MPLGLARMAVLRRMKKFCGGKVMKEKDPKKLTTPCFFFEP